MMPMPVASFAADVNDSRAPRTIRRRFVVSAAGAWLTAAFAMLAVSADALTLTGAQSRKTHGTAGAFGIDIDRGQPVGGAVTIEPRALGNGHHIAFQFDAPVQSFGTPVASDELGAPLGGLTATSSGSEVVITIPALPDNKRATVMLPNVNGLADFQVSVGFLLGDVNGSGSNSSADVPAVKSRAGQTADGTNFRFDINTSGAIGASDILAVKSRPDRNLVSATAVQTFALTVTKSGAGSGTVSSQPSGISCGATCAKTFNAGTLVTLTATPGAGSTFAGWSGACAGVAACSVTMSAANDVTASFALAVVVVPPDPATVAPPNDPTLANDILASTAFLYSGASPIQGGVAPGTIDVRRAAVLRGVVKTRDGTPLSGVSIAVQSHPEFGQTATRADGGFDMVVNGGGLLNVTYRKNGFLPVQRSLNVLPRDFQWLPDVVMIPFDTVVTPVALGAPTVTVARGSAVTDTDGTRQATMLFMPGTTALLVMPDGSTQPVTALNVRATEYTVGSSGPQAMPAPLPPASAYTYAVELSVDEAVAVGAASVRFNQPVPVYLENFLGFAVGSLVPSGYFDAQRGQWVASANGRVIKVLSVAGGVASVDADGDNVAEDAAALMALGITDAERTQLAQLYAAGQTLWRVPVAHFTPWDFNWPFGPPLDAVAPPAWVPNALVDDPCITLGSIIGCENQSLGESIPVTGTPWKLHYRSERTPGRKDAYQHLVRLSGSSVPASLKRIVLQVTVAGRIFSQNFPPSANQTYNFTWDGRDAYGRTVQGRQPLQVRIGYTYAGVYLTPSQRDALLASEPMFGHYSFLGTPVSGNLERKEVTLWQDYGTRIGPWDNRALGLGGWSLSAQHLYDAPSQQLLLGDGRQRSVEGLPAIISTAAGTGVVGNTGDGGPATAARFNVISAIAVGPDGSVYVADIFDSRVRRIQPDGTITAFAGTGVEGFSGDGGPATAAQVDFVTALAVGPDGSVYICESRNPRIRRVAPNGIISTIAGTGASGFSGDGGPALAAKLGRTEALKLGPDGSLYLSDAGARRVRRIEPNGTIRTIAGGGGELDGPVGLALGGDGSLYIGDRFKIRRVSPDGIITTIAGGAPGFSGDGGPALQARFNYIYDLAAGPDGSLYITDGVNLRVRRIGADGVINTIAGNGVKGSSGDGGPAPAAQMQFPTMIALAPDGSLYIGDYLDRRIRRVRTALPDVRAGDQILGSADGSEVYVFNSGGRHLRTHHAVTGAIKLQFAYDAAGYLTSLTDGNGNVTTIERNGAQPTAIVAPGGQRTALTTRADGWLLSATNPAAEAIGMTYSTDGLLQDFTTPRGNVSRFTYDAQGRLTKDEDAAGGSITLARTDLGNGQIVTVTSGLGQVRSFKVERFASGAVRRTVTGRTGAQTVTTSSTDGTQVTTNPDGTQITTRLGPDPRFGMQSPRLLERVRTATGGPVETITSARNVSLSDPNNILSVQAFNESLTVNARTFSRSYDAATRTLTDTSAESRQTTTVLDTQGRVVSRTLAPGTTAVTVTYDAQGRMTALQQGTQGWTYTYDSKHRVSARTDAAGRSTGYEYDDADRVVRKTLPGGGVYQFAYDADGNRTSVTLPGGGVHALGYSAVNLDSSYTPPGNAAYARAFNIDRQLTGTTLPGGRTTSQAYDALGRVTGLNAADADTVVSYAAGDLTERVAGLGSMQGGTLVQDIAYTHTGGLITGMASTGAAPADAAFTYNNDFLPTAMNLTSGADTLQSALTWDRDGLIKTFGPFAFVRGGPRGAVSQLRDATATTNITYDALARPATRSHAVNAMSSYATSLSYDNTGRISGKTETVAGSTITYAYAYDALGQLTEVRRGGTLVESYAYDANGNRLSRQVNGGPLESATYDAQDRLLQRGAIAYQFNADGFLAQRGTDSFTYSTRGRLLSATVGAQTVTYAYDGLGRRVSRTDAGGTTRFLYGDPASYLVTAVRAPDGTLTALYYSANGLLVALERGGSRYYVATDQVGSPRVVADATGASVKVIEYDTFGNVLSDSNPAFGLPLGYAGGLADAVTGLVHFFYRDYEPASGRWTARDPLLFGAGQGNLYAYVRNNPVAYRDPTGLFCISATAYEGVGGGVGLCITDEGASVCGELGFGVGVSVGADIGGDIEKTGAQVVAELAYGVGPAKVSIGASLDSGGCLSLSPKGQLGPVTLELDKNLDPTKLGADLEVEGSPKIGAGGEAKIAAKGCVGGKF